MNLNTLDNDVNSLIDVGVLGLDPVEKNLLKNRKKKNRKQGVFLNTAFDIEDEERLLIDFEDSRVIKTEGSGFLSLMPEVVKKYPDSSFYFLNEEELEGRASVFLEEFEKGRANRFVAYAVKANPLPQILRILRDAGIRSFDCASLGEILRVNELVDLAHIFFNNPTKDRTSIREAFERKIKHFTVDTKSEVEKLINTLPESTDLELAVRINSDIGEESSAAVPLFEKFGMEVPEGQELIDFILATTDAEVGVSLHVGSQNMDAGKHVRHAKKLLKSLKKKRRKIKAFNLGGGMPVLHGELDKKKNKTILANYLRKLEEVVREEIEPFLVSDRKVIIEPGRAMVGTSVDLLVAINDVKKDRHGNRSLRIDDGVFGSFSDAILHSWQYPFLVLDKDGKEVKGKKVKYTLEGRTCDSGDVMKEVYLPENISPEHYLWVPNSGAYHYCQGSPFNGMRPHKHVAYSSE